MRTLERNQIKDINIKLVLNNIREKYILVEWPEIQYFMDSDRWGECIFCQEIEGHPCPDGAYMVPESLYNQLKLN